MLFRGNRLALAAAMLAALTVLAASQATREEVDAVKESMRQLTLRNPLYVTLPTENNCQSNTLRFILGCLELLPWVDDNLGVALNKVADIDGESVLVDGQVIVDVLANKNPPMPQACCNPLCSLAKAGCACNDVFYGNLVELVGGSESVASSMINSLHGKCVAEFPELVFEPTMKGTKQCGADYASIAETWQCPA